MEVSEQLYIDGLEPTPWEELAQADIELHDASEAVSEASIRYNRAILGRILIRNQVVMYGN
jgi:hypothetical protein